MSAYAEQIANSHFSGANADYIESLYERFLADPAAVPEAWRHYFAQLSASSDIAHGPVKSRIRELALHPLRALASNAPQADYSHQAAEKQAAVLKLINAYRVRGHEGAQLDPLGLMERTDPPDLDPAYHGLTDADLDTEFNTGSLVAAARMPLRAIIDLLRRTYAGTIGVEYMHIVDSNERAWLQEHFEGAGGDYGLDLDTRHKILKRLTMAEGLERYLQTRFVGQKRFGLEGGDSLIPLVRDLVHRLADGGTREITIGMAHRGRLNVLVNVLGKAPRELFDEFEGKHAHADPAHSGDVKYHMGFSSDLTTAHGPVHVALGFNPSHLEIIDPVVIGSVRARQVRRSDVGGDQVVPILIHGDAAFCGQGVVMETFNMSQTRGFGVGGTIHIIVNNQVGFTTHRPDDVRSTMYCTDIAKVVQAPIFHVNADDPEAVVFVGRIAAAYRRAFKKDVVIDLYCYRRNGHNEADEPSATQPLMYRKIKALPTTRQIYADRLLAAGEISSDEVDQLINQYRDALDAGQPVAEIAVDVPRSPYTCDWSPHLSGDWTDVPTAVDIGRLIAAGAKLGELPAGFALHPRVQKLIDDRRRMHAGELKLDWGAAETLAYASLLEDGYQVRIVGQDCGRGTFFHRHAVLHEQHSGEALIPLTRFADRREQFRVIDSLLSEEAVMAFEYGYSTNEPRALVIWEGQFGDFANGAQVVIDQFISSGESKWGRLSSLVLFLPHGYEGQGPEHSSARLERFLQLCAHDNMQVVVPTSPAQMFHMLRRQMLRRVRKPLVVMTPKSMLRLEASSSALEELAGGAFQTVIDDPRGAEVHGAQRIVLCSGKVYYDLARELNGRTDIGLVRIEQLYPFPREALEAVLAAYGDTPEIVWCQEEPVNQGAWFFIRDFLRPCLKPGQRLAYTARPASAAPAAGHLSQHTAEQATLLERALTLVASRRADTAA